MKTPFSKFRDQKQALESYVVKQQAYMLSSVLNDISEDYDNEYIMTLPAFKKWNRLLGKICEKYCISCDDLDDNYYYVEEVD